MLKYSLGQLLFMFSVFAILYTILRDKRFSKVEDMVLNTVSEINGRYEKRVIEAKTKQYIKNNKKNRLGYLDDLILRSRIRLKIPFFSSEILLLICILTALFNIKIIDLFSENYLLKIEGIVLGIMLPILLLEQLATMIFNSIDDNVLFFMDTAINFSKTENELGYILTNTSELLNGDLKKVISNLANDLKRGVIPEEAFDRAIERIDNIRFKELLKNLYTASLGDADYEGVIKKARKTHEYYYKLKEDRQEKIKESRKDFAVLLIAGIVVLRSLKGISPLVYTRLNSTNIGMLITAIFGLSVLVAIYRFFSLSKFNY